MRSVQHADTRAMRDRERQRQLGSFRRGRQRRGEATLPFGVAPNPFPNAGKRVLSHEIAEARRAPSKRTPTGGQNRRKVSLMPAAGCGPKRVERRAEEARRRGLTRRKPGGSGFERITGARVSGWLQRSVRMHLPHAREVKPQGRAERARGNTSQPLTRDGEGVAGSGERVPGKSARTEYVNALEPGSVARRSHLPIEGVLGSRSCRL